MGEGDGGGGRGDNFKFLADKALQWSEDVDNIEGLTFYDRIGNRAPKITEVTFDPILQYERMDARIILNQMMPLAATNREMALTLKVRHWFDVVKMCRLPQPHELRMYQQLL